MLWILFRLLFLLLPSIEGGGRILNDYITHYELLDYSPHEVHSQHLRSKRESNPLEPHVSIKFHSHSTHFHLRLKRDASVFSTNLQLDSDMETNEMDTSHLYTGELEGVGGSHVFGSLSDGVFDGQIITPSQTFFVERVSKYGKELQGSPPNSTLHSIIYSERHMRDPHEHKRTGHVKGCGMTDEVAAWMESVQNSENKVQEELSHPKSKIHLKDMNNPDHFAHSEPYYKYLKETNSHPNNLNTDSYNQKNSENSGKNGQNSEKSGKNGQNSGKNNNKNRGRRALGSASRTTCTLSIQTDPLLWKHIAEQERTTDETKIREEILSLIAQHVKAVNYIYSNTLFDGKQSYKNIRFEVQRIKIDTDKACRADYKGEKNLFCIENIDVSNFLNLHSLTDHHVFCLAYVFTYRDFTGGTLGLAWVASASGASGGVCEMYKTYTETIGGVYQSTRRSLNTGIITFVNYNSRVPPKVSQLTLAHEIGHNFGSPHDYPNRCRPGGGDGNYIMFASATSGDRPNNSKFSECSVKNISSVLDAIYDSKKSNCFISTNGTFCGNKIVEEGEECDCGYNYEECEESCCYPRSVSQSDIASNPGAAGCRRKPGARCSPSEGPCCDARTCSFVPARSGVLCKQETECSLASYCNGTAPSCPIATPKADITTPCNDGTQVCQRGECQGSICLKFSLRECFLSSGDKSVDKRKLCELACLTPYGECKSTSELNLPGLTSGLSLRPGAPCDNFQGYCDVFLKCRAVDAEGPLARLKNLLFNKQTLLNIAQWVTEYWWGVMLIGVGFIVLMGLFIKCCAVHTPSSNPKKAPARRIGDTLRRPINTLRRHRHSHGHNYRGASSGAHSSAPPLNPPSSSSHQNGGLPPPPYSSSSSSSTAQNGQNIALNGPKNMALNGQNIPKNMPNGPKNVANGPKNPTPLNGGQPKIVPPLPGGQPKNGPPLRPHGFGENRGPNRSKQNNSRPGGRGSGGQHRL